MKQFIRPFKRDYIYKFCKLLSDKPIVTHNHNFLHCAKAEDLKICIVVNGEKKNSKSQCDLELDQTMPNVEYDWAIYIYSVLQYWVNASIYITCKMCFTDIYSPKANKLLVYSSYTCSLHVSLN